MHICAKRGHSAAGLAFGGRLADHPPMSGMPGDVEDTATPPRIALEGAAATPAALAGTLAGLRARGHRILEAPAPERTAGPAHDVVIVCRVRTAEEAARVMRSAIRGHGIVVVGHGDRAVLDQLYDDLRRFGRLDVRTHAGRAPDEVLDGDERSLLDLLAAGRTLGEAAAALHLSRRTVDRRLASARTKLGAATTAETLARLRGVQ
jgi:DNA-binding CsgD family transcriptional regulator